MLIETNKNRDLFFKICFIYFANYILKILGIDEEIEEIYPTELITVENVKKPKMFDNFLDFAAVTKSGTIMIFEFKKHPLRRKDLKQAYEYFDRIHCKKQGPVRTIIITISNRGKLTEYTEIDITFHPKIVKTKKINKQQDLSSLRYKFNHNIKLTILECALVITLPLFKLNESEAEITEEMCKNLKENPDCIPPEELEKMIPAMYLNILEYIDDKEKQNELMEMIGMTEKIKGIIAQIKNEARNQGKEDFINKLLEKHTLDEVSEFSGMDKATLFTILQK